MAKIKNIIIFVVIAAIFASIYFFYIKKSSKTTSVSVSTSSMPITVSNTASMDANKKVAQDFLDLLLNIKSIKLNDDIFSDIAFTSLYDSSIILVPDGNEGRINPFAPIGTDSERPLPPTCNLPKILDISNNTCVNLPTN